MNKFEIIKNHNLIKTNLSVIISLYNYGKYINKAIDSVIKNNFKELEIVVINDASTDDSLEKVLPYLKTENNVTIIDKKTNTGLVEVRNLGIDLCVGEYVFILDADNEINENCLIEHYKIIKEKNTIACYGIIECYDEENYFVKEISNEKFNFERLKKGNYIDAMAMFNKKKLIEIGKYDTELINHGIGWEDFELWLRIGNLGYDVEFINKTLSKYLIKKQSMVVTTNLLYGETLSNYLNKKFKINLLFE